MNRALLSLCILIGACSDDAGDSTPAAPADAGDLGQAEADAGVADSAAPALLPRPSGGGVPKQAAVFDEDVVGRYELTVEDEEWRRLQATARDEVYVKASLKVNGEDVGVIGLRYKGAVGTLQQCFDSKGKATCPKISFKLKFDEYEMDKRFHGLKRLNLHALMRDPTFIHERLGYKLFRDMNIPAPRSVHARVSVNGTYQGVFAVTEQIDGRFTADRFPGFGDGALYKEAWPTSIDGKAYDAKLKTNEDDAQEKTHGKLISFAKALAQAGAEPAALAPVVDAWTDSAYMMRVLAVDRAISNWDGFVGFYCSSANRPCTNHNFYLYEDPRSNRFWFIPWDLDNTFSVGTVFDQVPAWDDPAPACDKRWSVWSTRAGAPGCDPVFKGLRSAGRAAYLKAVQMLLDGPFDLKRLDAQIDAWAAQIEDAVKVDPTVANLASWKDQIAKLKRDSVYLRIRLEHLRDAMEAKPFGLSLDKKNDFDDATPLGFMLGSMSMANPASSIDHGLSTGDAVAELGRGKAEAVTLFELRNQSDDAEKGKWAQWANFRLAFSSDVDVSEVKKIRLQLRSDKARKVRLDLDSALYKRPETGVRFGWDLSVLPTGKDFTVDLAKIAIPSWGTSQGDDVPTVLKVVNGLLFSPDAVGRSAAGVFAPGGSDKGWVAVDDVEFLRE